MTQRQQNLQDEIIRISDIFQLGLSKGDQDWFYKFINRMDESKEWGNGLLFRLDFVSKDFYEEFKDKGYGGLLDKLIFHNPHHAIKLFGFNEALKLISPKYRDNDFIKFIANVKDILKDEWVEENIELFDDSCNPSCKWTYYNRDKYSPYHYVFQSKSISQKLKDKYRDKPELILHFDVEPIIEKKKSFLKNIFN